MRIGIIGAGNIGGTLAKRFVEEGHVVEIANSRGPETLANLAAETGAEAVEAARAPEGKDVLVITIPEGKVPDLPGDLLDNASDDLVVIDTGNYYPQRDGAIEAIESGMPESAWVAEQIGHGVVKAFNNIYFVSLGEKGMSPGAEGRIALPLSGDNDRDKSVVEGLIDEIGFDPVDAGGLDQSWRQQPGTPVYTADADADGVRAALEAASPDRPAEFRASPE